MNWERTRWCIYQVLLLPGNIMIRSLLPCIHGKLIPSLNHQECMIGMASLDFQNI
jgi:hypothetical protein